MKKFITLILILLISSSVLAQKRNVKNKYFYAVGWEYLPMPGQSEANKQPVVTNVFSTRCKEEYQPIKTGITNELNDYYKAFYSISRGFNGINRAIAFGPYKSWEEAEKERRKSIASYNRDWHPLLVSDFSVSCD